MSSLLDHENFRMIYEQLREVSLNPARHEARNVYDHCERVRERIRELAARNKLGEGVAQLLDDVALAHDIGKVTGSSRPKASLKILQDLNLGDERLLNLVKYHDINLPWYQFFQRGEGPQDRDWQKLGNKIEMRLLLIFMIADRVDCPGGWRKNEPLQWFIGEIQHRNMLTSPINIEVNETIPPLD